MNVQRPFVLLLMLFCRGSSAQISDPRYRIGPLLEQDDFQSGLAQWTVEAEQPGTILATKGVLDLDVPAGLTLWLNHKLSGPVMIAYDVTEVAGGGANDKVTDLNCFWMASDPRRPAVPLPGLRHGKFSEYNSLLTYYVGQGGNLNTTTRFRRYLGSDDTRTLLPRDDLSAKDTLLEPNHLQHVQLVADGSLIQYFRDGKKIFETIDPAPYPAGWFALRTVHNHMRVQNFRVYRLVRLLPAKGKPAI